MRGLPTLTNRAADESGFFGAAPSNLAGDLKCPEDSGQNWMNVGLKSWRTRRQRSAIGRSSEFIRFSVAIGFGRRSKQ